MRKQKGRQVRLRGSANGSAGQCETNRVYWNMSRGPAREVSGSMSPLDQIQRQLINSGPRPYSGVHMIAYVSSLCLKSRNRPTSQAALLTCHSVNSAIPRPFESPEPRLRLCMDAVAEERGAEVNRPPSPLWLREVTEDGMFGSS